MFAASSSQSGTTPEPEFIYHLGDRIKDLALHRTRDYETGLSFLDYLPPGEHTRFKVSVLKAANFEVVFDGDKPMVKLPFFGGMPYIEPNSGVQWNFPRGHVTVYHREFDYWTQWHLADLENFASPLISPYLQECYDLSTL